MRYILLPLPLTVAQGDFMAEGFLVNLDEFTVRKPVFAAMAQGIVAQGFHQLFL